MRKFLKIAIAIMLLIAVVVMSVPYVIKTLYPLKYREYIEEYSAKYDLDPFLVMGVISAESRFSESAVSQKSAKGLMQLKDDTAYWCAEKYGIAGEVYEARVNIEIGCAYLRYLLDLFSQNVDNALAAYNAGQGNVRKWLKDERYSTDGITLNDIPYKETKEYVKRVKDRTIIYRKIYANK